MEPGARKVDAVHHVYRAPELALIRHTIRGAVCTQCCCRPPGSEALGPDVPRSCEPECPVFTQLPAIARMAETVDPTLGRRAAMVEHWIRHVCRERQRPGGKAGAASPLRWYAAVIARELDELLRW